MLFHDVGELREKLASDVSRGVETPGGLESFACCCNREIDIGGVSDGDFGNLLAGSRVHHTEWVERGQSMGA